MLKFFRARAAVLVSNAVPRCTAEAISTCAGAFPTRAAIAETHINFMLHELTILTVLEIDLDVSARPRATDQGISFCRLFQRLRLIINCPGNHSRFASMADAGSTGPPHRHVACFREFQQAEPIRTPRHGQSTSGKRNIRSRTGGSWRLMGWPRPRAVDPWLYGRTGAENFRKDSARWNTPAFEGRRYAPQELGRSA
jgi:hypothetical protein